MQVLCEFAGAVLCCTKTLQPALHAITLLHAGGTMQEQPKQLSAAALGSRILVQIVLVAARALPAYAYLRAHGCNMQQVFRPVTADCRHDISHAETRTLIMRACALLGVMACRQHSHCPDAECASLTWQCTIRWPQRLIQCAARSYQHIRPQEVLVGCRRALFASGLQPCARTQLILQCWYTSMFEKATRVYDVSKCMHCMAAEPVRVPACPG